MSDPRMAMRWAYAPTDRRWHLCEGGSETEAARCGHPLPRGAEPHDTPIGLPCGCCAALRRAEHPTAQRGRLWVRCTRLDTGAQLSVMVTHEWDGAAWTIHAPAAVRLNPADMVFLCAAVLMRSAQARRRAQQTPSEVPAEDLGRAGLPEGASHQ